MTDLLGSGPPAKNQKPENDPSSTAEIRTDAVPNKSDAATAHTPHCCADANTANQGRTHFASRFPPGGCYHQHPVTTGPQPQFPGFLAAQHACLPGHCPLPAQMPPHGLCPDNSGAFPPPPVPGTAPVAQNLATPSSAHAFGGFVANGSSVTFTINSHYHQN